MDFTKGQCGLEQSNRSQQELVNGILISRSGMSAGEYSFYAEQCQPLKRLQNRYDISSKPHYRVRCCSAHTRCPSLCSAAGFASGRPTRSLSQATVVCWMTTLVGLCETLNPNTERSLLTRKCCPTVKQDRFLCLHPSCILSLAMQPTTVATGMISRSGI